jgi:hypothetical protein
VPLWPLLAVAALVGLLAVASGSLGGGAVAAAVLLVSVCPAGEVVGAARMSAAAGRFAAQSLSALPAFVDRGVCEVAKEFAADMIDPAAESADAEAFAFGQGPDRDRRRAAIASKVLAGARSCCEGELVGTGESVPVDGGEAFDGYAALVGVQRPGVGVRVAGHW